MIQEGEWLPVVLSEPDPPASATTPELAGADEAVEPPPTGESAWVDDVASCLASAGWETTRNDELLSPQQQADLDQQTHQWQNERLDCLEEIQQLPTAIRDSQLVTRLSELLTRQSQRGTAKHLADDLRELSARDADAAHDSLGLVRIIIWATPMLGFLGTVIGITLAPVALGMAEGAWWLAIVTLIAALQNRGLKKGIAGLCIGGGEATAMAIELL